MTGKALSQFPGPLIPADVTHSELRRRMQGDALKDEVCERLQWLPRLEPDRKDSGTEPQKPNPSL